MPRRRTTAAANPPITPRPSCPTCAKQHGWNPQHVLSFPTADALAAHLREQWHNDFPNEKGKPTEEIIADVARWFSSRKALAPKNP